MTTEATAAPGTQAGSASGNPGSKPPPPGANGKDSSPPGAASAAAQEAADDMEFEAIVAGEKRKVSKKKLLSDYQKYETADRRLMSAAEREKKVEAAEAKLRQFLQSGQKNPKYLLEKILGSPEAVKKFTEDYVWENIQNEKKTPEQLELERLRQEKEERAMHEASQKEGADKDAATQRMTQLRDKYDRMFSEVLEKSSLPKTAETVERMSKIYMSYLKNRYEPSMDELMTDVEQSYLTDIKGLLGHLSGEKLYKLLGEDLWKKAREYDVSRLSGNSRQQSPPPTSNVNTSTPDERIPMHDARALWRKRAGV